MKSKTPQQATGHPACYAASCGVFDPRGIRQMQEKSIPALGSLLAGIKPPR